MSQYWSALVHTLTPYVPGEQPKLPDLVKLNTNENPYPPSPRALAAMQAELGNDAARLRLYPDPNGDLLKHAVAEHFAEHGIEPAQVFVGNGSDEVLAHAFLALLKRFENSQGDAVEETRRLLAAGQAQQAAQLLHRVCGVAANLGATHVASLAGAAEKALKAAPPQATASLLQQLENAMSEVIVAARTLPLPRSEPLAAAPGDGQIDLRAGLAELLVLIRNNNLKALARFHALHPAIQQSDREAALAMANAIETLNFSEAEKLVLDQLKREENK